LVVPQRARQLDFLPPAGIFRNQRNAGAGVRERGIALGEAVV